MKRFVIGLIVGILLLGTVIWNIIHAVRISNEYKEDRKYAFAVTGQAEYYKMKEEDYVKGIYSIRSDNVISGDDRYIKAQADIVTVDFAVADMLSLGADLLIDDVYGCIVSSELSNELFGTDESVGTALIAGGADYIVRDVVQSVDNFVIVQAEKERGGDWAYVNGKVINGIVVDVSDENYRGEYIEALCNHHGYDDKYYYVTDYLDVFPDINLPSKWSDFDFWNDISSELKEIAERRLYADKDVLEIFYYRRRQTINTYRQRSAISALLLAGWCVMVLVNIRKNSKKTA